LKRNMVSVITLALLIINLILTALLLVSVLPETRNANNLISKVAGAIDLETGSSAKSKSSVNPDDINPYSIKDAMMINLKADSDGNSAIASVTAVLSQDKNSKSYKKFGGSKTDGYADIIKDIINKTVREYTKEEFQSNTDKVQKEILNKLNDYFGNNLYVSVGFPTSTVEDTR
jgi:hypothetical protein